MLGDGNLQVKKIAIYLDDKQVDEIDPTLFDSEDLKRVGVEVKALQDIRVRIDFVVNRQKVTNLKYIHKKRRTPNMGQGYVPGTVHDRVSVGRQSIKIGDVQPGHRIHSVFTQPECVPGGEMGLGYFYVYSSFADENGTICEWEWSYKAIE